MPGRSFNPEPATEESRAAIALLGSLGVDQWLCHIDLHETTDTDETEFRPAKAARDGLVATPDVIPDGFYLVSDETNPREAWHAADKALTRCCSSSSGRARGACTRWRAPMRLTPCTLSCS